MSGKFGIREILRPEGEPTEIARVGSEIIAQLRGKESASKGPNVELVRSILEQENFQPKKIAEMIGLTIEKYVGQREMPSVDDIFVLSGEQFGTRKSSYDKEGITFASFYEFANVISINADIICEVARKNNLPVESILLSMIVHECVHAIPEAHQSELLVTDVGRRNATHYIPFGHRGFYRNSIAPKISKDGEVLSVQQEKERHFEILEELMVMVVTYKAIKYMAERSGDEKFREYADRSMFFEEREGNRRIAFKFFDAICRGFALHMIKKSEENNESKSLTGKDKQIKFEKYKSFVEKHIIRLWFEGADLMNFKLRDGFDDVFGKGFSQALLNMKNIDDLAKMLNDKHFRSVCGYKSKPDIVQFYGLRGPVPKNLKIVVGTPHPDFKSPRQGETGKKGGDTEK